MARTPPPRGRSMHLHYCHDGRRHICQDWGKLGVGLEYGLRVKVLGLRIEGSGFRGFMI
jgi:hypothetical protein